VPGAASSLASIAQDVFELYEPLAEDKAIEARLEAAPGTCVMGNRQLIAQAIANLVDNAIKYTPEGGRVGLTVRGGPRPEIIVADSGPGIPEELRERALERFVRLQLDRSSPGNGLGLSLVDAVARLHDAELQLEDNQPGLRVTLRFKPRVALGQLPSAA
jgi:signal transduction histidine kinase